MTMELVIIALVGVSSAITLIVAFILCAKRQSFTIEHDYDPNYISPSVRDSSSYRTRHVHQPIKNLSIENGHSKNRSELSNSNDRGIKTSDPEVKVNNNVKVTFIKETSGGTTSLERKDEDKGRSPKQTDRDDQGQARARVHDIQRETSKRKAPTVPVGQTVSGQTRDGQPPITHKSVDSSAVSQPAPTRSDTTHSEEPTSQGQKTTTSNQKRQSKKKAPAPVATPTKAAADLIRKEAPTKPSAAATPVSLVPTNTGTNSLPRPMKTASSPERVHYVKKSSTLPGKGSKRMAPVAPGQAKPVQLSAHKSEISTSSEKDPTEASPVSSSRSLEPPAAEHLTPGNDSDNEKAKRHSRNVLDRLPSLPKENSFDSGLDVKQSDNASLSVGSDTVDGPDEVEPQVSIEEDPYSIIKNKKLGEEGGKNDVVDGSDSHNTSALEGGIIIDSNKDTEHSTDNPPVAQDDGVVLELAPDTAIDGTLPEAVVKAEPPYAKVIKRNKRNRANVRVHFSTEHPEEIKPNYPPTPGPLVSMMKMEGEEAGGKDGDCVDDHGLAIPEAASYD